LDIVLKYYNFTLEPKKHIMKHELIKTEDYLLVVSDEEIKDVRPYIGRYHLEQGPEDGRFFVEITSQENKQEPDACKQEPEPDVCKSESEENFMFTSKELKHAIAMAKGLPHFSMEHIYDYIVYLKKGV
jgi:hypothetical protein